MLQITRNAKNKIKQTRDRMTIKYNKDRYGLKEYEIIYCLELDKEKKLMVMLLEIFFLQLIIVVSYLPESICKVIYKTIVFFGLD